MTLKKLTLLMGVGISTTIFTVEQQNQTVFADQTINWTEPSSLTTTNPSQANDATATEIVTQIGQGLYRNGKHNKAELADAKSVDISDGGRKYTFHLKSNLRWSDGEQLTANDYVYGIQQTVSPKNKSNGATLATPIKNATEVTNGTKPANELGVKAIDNNTLEITLNEPVPSFKSILASSSFYPEPQKFVTKLGDQYGTSANKTLSNGPFVLKKWNGSSDSYQLEKNKFYEDSSDVKTKRINVQTVVDNSTGYNLYKSGKSDYTPLTADQVRINEKNKAYHSLVNGRTDFLGLNTKQKYLKYKDMRIAIRQSIDTKGLTNKVLKSIERPGRSFTPENTITNPKNHKDFSKEATTKQYPFNKSMANKRFKSVKQQLGSSKIHLSLLADNDEQSKVEAQYIQSQLQKNLPGLTLTIKFVPKAARVKAQLAHQFDIVLTSWGGDYADPMSFLNLFTSDSGINIAQFNDNQYDNALKRANGEDVNNQSARYQDLIQAEHRLQSELPIVTLGHKSTPALIRPDVKGLVINTYGATFDFKKAYKAK